MDIISNEQKIKSAKNLALAVYILQFVGIFVVGTATLIGLIINYIKRSDVQGTFIESHFRWQIRTFWFAVLWTIIGYLTLVFYIGMVILFANAIWYIYRIVKGFLYLNDQKPMY